LRIAISVVAALFINAGMFLLMHSMVSRDRERIVNLVETQQIEFVRTPLEEETRTRDRRSAPPPKPQEIERPRAQVTDIAQRVSSLPAQVASYSVASLLAETGAGAAIGQVLLGAADNDLGVMMADDLIPLSMLPPQYPPAARQRGVTGWVDIIFTIDERGLVEDVTVIDSEPPEVFDRAAIDAAMRWRFRPLSVNGEPASALRRIRINFSQERTN